MADAQLLERARYYTEGFKETEALYRLFDYFDEYQHLCRNQFIFGILYLAYSRKYKLNFHNYPKTSVFAVGTTRSEFMFSKEI
jgi:hypothetical protein